MNIQIKKSWQEVTIAEYFQLLDILNSSTSEFDKEIRVLCLMAGVQDDYFNHMKPRDVKEYYDSIAFLLNPIPEVDLQDEYLIGTRRYKFIRMVKDLTFGQFWDLEKANSKDETRIKNLPVTLAAVLLPFKNSSKVESYCKTPLAETQDNILKNMSVVDAMSISFFLSNLNVCFTQTIQLYGAIMMQYQLMKVSTSLKDLRESDLISLPENMKLKITEQQQKLDSMLNGHG